MITRTDHVDEGKPSHALVNVASLVVLLLACTNADQAERKVAVSYRDSAGFQIVESSAPLWNHGEGWQVSPKPSVVIGSESSDPAYELSRVNGATRLSDGRIAVLEASSSQLHIYSNAGAHLRSVGRRGGGPGEFTRPEHLQRSYGDSLLVWDYGLGPVSVFNSDGDYIRRVRIDRARVMGMVGSHLATERLTPLPDRSFVLHVTERASVRSPFPTGKVIRPPLGFLRVRADESSVDSLGWYGGLPQMFIDVGGRRLAALVLFPTSAAIAAGGNPWAIYAGNGDVFEIRAFNEEGKQTRLIRPNVPPTRIPRSELERVRRGRLDAARRTGRQADVERELAALPQETHYPAYRTLLVDVEGNLWVRTLGDGWHVFDPRGHWLGPVSLPGMRVFEVGADYVLGVQLDELDVEHVAMYRLVRNSVAPAHERSPESREDAEHTRGPVRK